ncbi:MAG: M23 family metallopeptidase [Candidatus Sericytochromatia bacterium]
MLKRINLSAFFISLQFLFIVSPSFSEEVCTKDKFFCIETISTDDSVEFIAKNNVTYDLTTTLSFSKLINVESTVKLPYTFSLSGKTKKTILKLNQKDIDLKWSYRYNFHTMSGNFNAKNDYDYEYTLPFNAGEEYKVIQGYDGDYSHKGEQEYSIDFGMPEGTDVLACRDGKVVGIKNDSSTGGASKTYANQANFVMIEHSDKTIGAYLHLLKGTVLVKIGQNIKTGQLIAKSGNTGWSSAPHLHFWVYKAKNGYLRESFPTKFKIAPNKSDILYEDETYKAF